MRTVAPDYYTAFHCIADRCRHTCCEGWEVDIDDESAARFLADPLTAPHVDMRDTPHFRLLEGERCPFLRGDGLCRLIIERGEDVLCQTCRDHPRFRSYWTGLTEIGVGLVCEEAARLILGRTEPMRLVEISSDGNDEPMPEDEQWLYDVRTRMLDSITESGPRARLLEYLIYRHIPDALYDDRLEQRVAFIERSFREITEMWEHTDGSLDSIAECARAWSYDVEYDDEQLEMRISSNE